MNQTNLIILIVVIIIIVLLIALAFPSCKNGVQSMLKSKNKQKSSNKMIEAQTASPARGKKVQGKVHKIQPNSRTVKPTPGYEQKVPSQVLEPEPDQKRLQPHNLVEGPMQDAHEKLREQQEQQKKKQNKVENPMQHVPSRFFEKGEEQKRLQPHNLVEGPMQDAYEKLREQQEAEKQQKKQNKVQNKQFPVLNGAVENLFSATQNVEAELGMSEYELNVLAEKYKKRHLTEQKVTVPRNKAVKRSDIENAEKQLRQSFVNMAAARPDRMNTEEMNLEVVRKNIMSAESRKKGAKKASNTMSFNVPRNQ